MSTNGIAYPHPPAHFIFYGFSGAKKSTLAASFDVCGPGLVNMFDAYGMDGPYLRRGDKVEQAETKRGVPVKRVLKKGKLLWEIRYYHDADPDHPDAWRLFREEQAEFDSRKWSAWVVDSVNEAIDAALFEQATINKGIVHFRLLGPVTDQLSLHFKSRPKGYECNVILITQVAQKFVDVPSMNKGVPERRIDKRIEAAEESEEGRQILLRGIVAPGRLARDGGLVSQSQEVYRLYIERNKDGKPVWRVQTVGDGEWVAKTQIPAPDGCAPTYEALYEDAD